MRFTKVALSVLFLLAFIPTPADGQKEPPAPALATVSGRIVDSVEGTPFKDSYVWALEATGKFYKVAKAEKTGHYKVSVPEGDYYIVLGCSGYFPAVRAVFLHPGQAYHFSAKLEANMKNMIIEQP
jgi:hypothetical protein